MWIEADTLYDIVNAVAAAGWLLLVLLPQGKVTMLLVRNGALSITLAVGYVILLVLYFPGAEGGFASLQDVMQLFANPYLLVAGWLQYLAFDAGNCAMPRGAACRIWRWCPHWCARSCLVPPAFCCILRRGKCSHFESAQQSIRRLFLLILFS